MLSVLSRTGFGTGSKAHLRSRRVRQGCAGGTGCSDASRCLEATLRIQGQPLASPSARAVGPRQSLLGSLPTLPPSPPTPKGGRSQFGRAKCIVLRPGLGISTGTPPPSLMTSRYCLPFPVPLTAGKHANPQFTALIITRNFSEPRRSHDPHPTQPLRGRILPVLFPAPGKPLVL